MKKLVMILLVLLSWNLAHASMDSTASTTVTYITFKGRGNSSSFSKEVITSTPEVDRIITPGKTLKNEKRRADPDTIINDTIEKVYRKRERPTLVNWVRMHNDTIDDPTYREIAKQSEEHWGVATAKSLLLIPMYAIIGAGAVAAVASILFMMFCLLGFGGVGIAATLPYIWIGIAGLITSAGLAFTLFYLTELPFFDKARPIALWPYKAIGYVFIGLLYLIFGLDEVLG